MKELIRSLAVIAGASGSEGQVTNAIRERVLPFCDEVYTDVVGNLYAIKKAKTGNGSRQEVVMVAAHMDEPGLVVVDIDQEGFLRVEPLGNVQADTLVGARVLLGRTGRRGVVGIEHDVALKDIAFRHLFVDIGAKDKTAAEEHARIGDAAAFAYPVESIGDDYVIGHTLDNRVACAMLIEVLQHVQSSATIVAVFSAQKEVGSRGAQVAAYRVKPSLAVTLDISPTGDTPKAERIALRLGEGPAIKMLDAGMVVASALRDRLVAAAGSAGVAVQMEVSPRATSDAGAIFLSREGVPTCGIAIPARYAGTPSQMVSLEDVAAGVKLLTAFLEQAG